MTLALRDLSLLAFIGKSVTGILLCTLLSHFFGQWIDYPWSLVSLVAVLSPEGRDAPDLALTRIKANCVGAAVGIPILLLLIPVPWSMVIGAVLSLYLCDRLGLNVAARGTLAAMVIVLIHREGLHPWEGAVNRVLAVVTGSLLGWAVTYVFHSLIRLEGPAPDADPARRQPDA
ncbi:MAG TPA: FUSC family protein [Methylomirabilota bacterium]|jgi:uncharacterized membrane protein YgaE (UPF0421/DUF939 family)